jgi:hypothetical protein
MQNMEHKKLQNRVLTDAELDEINGGSILGRIAHFVRDLFSGPGDLRRSTDRPSDPVHK